MERRAEFEGKDLDEALAAASAALHVAPAELDYEVVEGGRRGVFGLGARSVRIRVLQSPGVRAAAEDDPPPARIEIDHGPEPPAQAEVSHANREHADDVSATLDRILALLQLDIEVDRQLVDGSLTFRLRGADESALVQKDAELLCALQFLLNRMAIRSWPGTGTIHLACAGHPAGRDDELVEVARRAAAEVARTGRPRRLAPMNAYERRLVHLTVREFEGLISRSEGEGTLRRVKISPAAPA